MSKQIMKAIGVFVMLMALLVSSVAAATIQAEGPRANYTETAGDEADLLNEGEVMPLDVVYIKINGDEVVN